MAAGDVNPQYLTSGTAAGLTNPTMVTADVEFGTGATGITAVTAAQLGLKFIEGFAAGVWGASTGVGEFVYSTDTFVSGGVETLNLECINDASTLVDRTVTVLFWGR